MKVSKNKLDVSQIFLAYMAFQGDAMKTAIACDMDEETVIQLAASENWSGKVNQLTKLKKGQPGDVQIQINRAVNYVQAHRLRSVVDSVLGMLQDPEQVKAFVTSINKNGETVASTKPLLDLVKAAEACHAMTSLALGDTRGTKVENTEDAASQIGLQVMKALQQADSRGIDSVALVRNELAKLDAITTES